ncbi:conserved hypothetical protein [metagenome]|uniref:Uncharacterized protein n=1 Tax=metagenome TaxID=256318 RepID=A0A2P2CGR7_9ZZZZ
MQPPRGYRDRVTTPGDESRTELAWREIVEHYGERAVLPDDATAREAGHEPEAGSVDAAPAARPDTIDDELDAPLAGTDDGHHVEDVGEREVHDDVPEVERFHPPAAPPFPRPRTWQRGLAWTGLFVAPVLALLVGLFSLGLPTLFSWALVAWFVGGFLYLVHEMPRSPRDPWDDGSRI